VVYALRPTELDIFLDFQARLSRKHHWDSAFPLSLSSSFARDFSILFFFFLKKKFKYLFVPCGLKSLFFAFYALFCISNGTSFMAKDGENTSV